MMKSRILSVVLTLALVLTMAGMNVPTTNAAKKKVTVKKVSVKAPYSKKVYVAKGKSIKLSPDVKVTPNKSANKKVKYQSKNKKIATVSSKGVVKGKKVGKTKVVISSKKNAKKKATVTVYVKKNAVKKVKMNTTAKSLYVGGKVSLKATVSAKKGASKKLYWTSSSTKVATVSQNGVVTAKGSGTATITAKAIDGSKKKATCKVTVTNRANTANKVSIVSARVVNDRTICFSLSSAATLDLSKISVKSKKNKLGTYQKSIEATGLETNDKKNYTLELFGNENVGNYEYVLLTISNLSGTKSLETCYKEPVTAYTDSSILTCLEGQNVYKYVYFEDAVGHVNYSVTNLPDGLEYEWDEEYGELYIEGDVTKAGDYDTVVKARDEAGNTWTQTIKYRVGSNNRLAAVGYDTNTRTGSSFSQQIKVVGGSGSYIFSKRDDATGTSVSDTGYVSGSIEVPGTYKVTVDVTDANNPALSTTVVMTINVRQTVKLSTTVRDNTGNGVAYAYIYATNADKNAKIGTYSSQTDSDGEISMSLPAGTWNIEVYKDYSSVSEYRYNVNVPKDTTIADFKLNVTPVDLVHPQGTMNYNSVHWKDKTGKIIGVGNTLWLKPGTYAVETVQDNDYLFTIMKKATATFTVSNKRIQVATTTVDRPGNVDITPVSGTFSANMLGGVYRYFSFVPTETGKYTIYSDATTTSYGKLFNSDYIQMKSASNSQGFKMIDNTLEAGKTYYIASKYWNTSKNGVFTVYIEKQAE